MRSPVRLDRRRIATLGMNKGLFVPALLCDGTEDFFSDSNVFACSALARERERCIEEGHDVDKQNQ